MCERSALHLKMLCLQLATVCFMGACKIVCAQIPDFLHSTHVLKPHQTRASWWLLHWYPSYDVWMSLQLFLYSALCNLGDRDTAPYPTAKSPGQKPISPSEFQAAREQARMEVRLIAKKRKAECESSP